MALLERQDYFLDIPGHPDCFGVEAGAGEWLSVYQRTDNKPLHVGDYPCEWPLSVIARQVTRWKIQRTQEHVGGQEDDGEPEPPVVT